MGGKTCGKVLSRIRKDLKDAGRQDHEGRDRVHKRAVGLLFAIEAHKKKDKGCDDRPCNRTVLHKTAVETDVEDSFTDDGKACCHSADRHDSVRILMGCRGAGIDVRQNTPEGRDADPGK